MTTNDLLDETIDICVRSGIDALKRAKFAWWPAEGQADFAEDNLWFHVGWALQNAGFHLYPKAQVAGLGQQHVDAVALHREYRCAIVIEAKRIYSAEKLASLGDDWARLQQIKLPRKWLSFPQPLNCYSLLLGSCWSEDYMQWWIDSTRANAPVRCTKGESLDGLRSALENASRMGAIDVQRSGWQPHWICFAVNHLPIDHWCAADDTVCVPADVQKHR